MGKQVYFMKKDDSIWSSRKRVYISENDELVIADALDKNDVEKIPFSEFSEISEDYYFVNIYKYIYVIAVVLCAINPTIPRLCAIFNCIFGGIVYQLVTENRAYSLRFVFKGAGKTFFLHSLNADDDFPEVIKLFQNKNPTVNNFKYAEDKAPLKYDRLFMIIPFFVSFILCFVFKHYY